jgi:hypothetical protein
MLMPRLFDTGRPRRAKAAYAALVDRIHAEGYTLRTTSSRSSQTNAGQDRRCCSGCSGWWA